MTDLTPGDRGGKRARLIASAGDLLYRHGVSATTLAEVAEAAAVPSGNVYYYFKTKDDLIRAVLDSRKDQVRVMLGLLDSRCGPDVRIKALTHEWIDIRDMVARYGCPFGTLAAELDRRDDGIDQAAAEPIGMILDWAEDQFRQMGRHDAHDLAVALLAGIQGAALLANAFRDPTIVTSHVRHLEHWIDTLT